MLKLSAYLPSLEDHDDLPSPLMDGDAVPAVVAPIAEINEDVLPGDDLGAVQVVEDLSAVPVESIVELPPHLDPTPMAPLEGEVIQEEIISENLDTEASQLLGAQIAMEGYSTLLRSAGKNMTRQSAAFMAVGMRRASRLLPGVSLGMEDESSGTQVMAMQQAKVDEKGLGTKIKEAGQKIWEWIKQKAKQFMEWVKKLRFSKEKQQKEVVYLIAATKAVETGNPTAVKGIDAPQGIKVATVLDAIHGEDVRAPKQKTVKLPAKFVPFLTKNGKLDLNLSVENDIRQKVVIAFIKDATALVNDISGLFKGANSNTTPEEIADRMSDLVKKHLGGKAGKWELHGMTLTRDDAGKLTAEKHESPGEVEVQLPSPQEIRRYLEDVKKVLDAEVEDNGVFEAYGKAQENMMRIGDQADQRIPQEKLEEIAREMGKVLKGNSFEDVLRDVAGHLDLTSTIALKASDFFLSNLLGKGNTISQEDFERLPSKGLMVIEQPRGPGMMARAGTAVREAWQKIKAYFMAKWRQFSDWAKNLWARVFGVEKNTDILLLTNDAVPDEGAPASGPVAGLPHLPTGTRLKSVQAARVSAPAEPGVAIVETPEVTSFPVNEAPGPSVPAGHVFVPELAQLMVGNAIELEPVWEEAMLNWLVRHYVPTQEKITRDLISYAGSAPFDDGIAGYMEVINRAIPQLFQGMPTDGVPGQRTIVPGEGCKIKVSQEGMLAQAQPVKIAKKRQLDQALSRQKKLLKALGEIEKGRLVAERQRGQLNSILDRRVASGVAEADVTKFYNSMERLVMVSSATVIANVIAKICEARVAVADAMIAARAKK